MLKRLIVNKQRHIVGCCTDEVTHRRYCDECLLKPICDADLTRFEPIPEIKKSARYPNVNLIEEDVVAILTQKDPWKIVLALGAKVSQKSLDLWRSHHGLPNAVSNA